LKKLRLANNEIAIVDMEAGIEHFGRGIETSLDAVVVVVEPSLESLSLAQKIKELTYWAGAHFAGAVLNKINSDTMLSQLTRELVKRDIRILGSISYHQQLLSVALEGRALDQGSNSDEISKIADKILELIQKFDLAHGAQIS
jgi:CO dehydrogenase maturation factor